MLYALLMFVNTKDFCFVGTKLNGSFSKITILVLRMSEIQI